MARAQLVHVMIDCHDPGRLVPFWSGLLGVDVAAEFGEAFVFLTAASPDGVAVGFQRVPEGKVVKNRVHPDLEVDDLEGATAWVTANGGALVAERDEGGARWNVVADPEGNELCLVQTRSS